jgi:cystathionine beta-synthase
VDEWIKSNDADSLRMARRLIRKEGLLCGGSSGAAVDAAVQIAKKYGPGLRIVTLLPDSVRNYMTKFMDDGWMRANGLSDSMWETRTVGDVLASLPRRDVVTAETSATVAEAVGLMKTHGVSQLPILENGRLTGILTETDVLSKLVEGRTTTTSRVAEVMFRRVETIHESEDAGRLPGLFADGLVAMVVDDVGGLKGLLTKLDLVDFLTHRSDA